MNSEMAELRKILDLFEGAGFTVTDLQANYFSRFFEIAIKSSSITEIDLDQFELETETDEFELETATAGEVVSLVEKNGYQVLDYCTDGVISKYEGTIYLKIASKEEE
jgi:hypothetical protein